MLAIRWWFNLLQQFLEQKSRNWHKIHNYWLFKFWQAMFMCSFCVFLILLLLYRNSIQHVPALILINNTIKKTWNHYWSQLLLWSEFCSNSWRVEHSTIWSEFCSRCVVGFLVQLTSAIRRLQLFFWSEFCYHS